MEKELDEDVMNELCKLDTAKQREDYINHIGGAFAYFKLILRKTIIDVE